jgi:hypothetical protein
MQPFPPLRVGTGPVLRYIRAAKLQTDEAFRCGRSSRHSRSPFAAVLFVAVEKLEPNRLYAYLFMFLIIAVGTLAIVDQLLP